MRRRRLLGALTAAAGSALAGCATAADSLERRADDGNAATTRTANESTTREAGPTTESSASSADDAADVTVPRGRVANAPAPSFSDADFAVMGTTDAPTVTLYGNWKCPYTREFVVSSLGDVVSTYVEPGALRLRFRALAYRNGDPFLGPDAPRAAWAGQAVWARDPASFWRYFATVFRNQPPERESWATAARLRTFMRAASVSGRDDVTEDVHAGRRDDRVRKTTRRARELDLADVPRLVAPDGTVVAPNIEPERTTRVLDRVADR